MIKILRGTACRALMGHANFKRTWIGDPGHTDLTKDSNSTSKRKGDRGRPYENSGGFNFFSVHNYPPLVRGRRSRGSFPCLFYHRRGRCGRGRAFALGKHRLPLPQEGVCLKTRAFRGFRPGGTIFKWFPPQENLNSNCIDLSSSTAYFL